MCIRELGYYRMDKQNTKLIPLDRQPQNEGISFPFEEGMPYRLLRGQKWSKWNTETEQWE
jgi:hypothetical protein